MSEKKNNNKQEVEVVVGNELATAVATGNIGAMLESGKKKGFSLTSEYLSMEDGEVARFAVMEVSTMTVEDKEGEAGATKEIEILLMIDENNSTVSAAQTVLVNSIKSQVPCMVEIRCKGDIKLAGGKKYTGFDVFPLEMTV